MKYNIADQKLKFIIGELGEEYKDLLIEQLLDDMHEADADQINPFDLIRLDVAVKSDLRRSKKRRRQNQMFSLLSMIGIIYALLGLVLFMWSELRSSLRVDSMLMISVLFICIGLFLLLLTSQIDNLMTRSQHYKRQGWSISPYEFVDKWKEVEALITELTPHENTLSLSSMIANLREARIISEQDKEIISYLLLIRNQIVHSRSIKLELSQQELRSILTAADKLISKLKKLI